MDKDIAGINLPMAIGFAALIDLLAEKGVITEAEYEKKFEEAKKSSHGFGYRRNEEKIVGVTDLETKISKALYELLKELYQSRAAKEFVDAYEREEQVREWSSEDFDYWLKLTDSVRRKMFPDHVCDAYEHEQRHEKQARETPKNGEVYRDIFGNRYFVLAVHERLTYGTPIDKPFVVVVRIGSKGEVCLPDLYTPSLEDFMNPTFKKE